MTLIYSELNWNVYCIEWTFHFLVEDNFDEFENVYGFPKLILMSESITATLVDYR